MSGSGASCHLTLLIGFHPSELSLPPTSSRIGSLPAAISSSSYKQIHTPIHLESLILWSGTTLYDSYKQAVHYASMPNLIQNDGMQSNSSIPSTLSEMFLSSYSSFPSLLPATATASMPNLLQDPTSVGGNEQNYTVNSMQNQSYSPDADTVIQQLFALTDMIGLLDSSSLAAAPAPTTTDVVIKEFINYPNLSPLSQVPGLPESTPSSASVVLSPVAVGPGMVTGGQTAPSQ